MFTKRYPTGRDPVPHIDVTKTKSNLELDGAKRLGRIIAGYWRERGFDAPTITIVKTAIDEARQEYVIRSDMIGALPS